MTTQNKVTVYAPITVDERVAKEAQEKASVLAFPEEKLKKTSIIVSNLFYRFSEPKPRNLGWFQAPALRFFRLCPEIDLFISWIGPHEFQVDVHPLGCGIVADIEIGAPLVGRENDVTAYVVVSQCNRSDDCHETSDEAGACATTISEKGTCKQGDEGQTRQKATQP